MKEKIIDGYVFYSLDDWMGVYGMTQLSQELGIDPSTLSRKRGQYIRKTIYNGSPHYAIHNPLCERGYDAATRYYKIK